MEHMETSNSANENVTTCASITHSGRIHVTLSLVLLLLAAFLFAETIKSFKEYRYVGGGIAPSNAITVSGEGEVFAVPDTAEFTYTVEEEAETAAEVQDLANAKANEVVEALKGSGIDVDADVKTISHNLQPKYEWKKATNCLTYNCPQNREQVGFVITHTERVKVRDLDKAGEILELVTDKEVSSVSGLTFTIADEEMLQDEARKKAIDEAKGKAEKLANDLGVSLVRIVGFSEGSGYTPVYRSAVSLYEATGMGAMDTADESVAIQPGENKVTSSVNITYEIR